MIVVIIIINIIVALWQYGCLMVRIRIQVVLVTDSGIVCLLVCCITSHQHASVSQGRICSDSCTCCHTEVEVADQTFYLTQSQYTDTRPTSPSTDPRTPGAWQGSHWSANVLSHWYDWTRKNPGTSGIRNPDLPLLRQTP